MSALRRSSFATVVGVLVLGGSSLLAGATTAAGAASATPTATSSITAPVPTGAAPSPQEGLNDISCPSLGTCVAVGVYTTAASDPSNSSPGFPSPMETTLANGTWSALGLALPSNANLAQPESSLNGISCPVATWCVAVGQYALAGGGKDPLLESLGAGGIWTAMNAPLPSDAGNDPTLQSVSCPAVGSCVAVGSVNGLGAGANVFVPVIETLSGGNWTVTEPNLPSNAYIGSGAAGPLGSLSGVDCTATGSCVAVGAYGITQSTDAPLVESLSGGAWTPQFAPSPATTTSDTPTTDNAVFNSVSCPANASCVAVGSFSDVTASVNTLVDSLTSGAWALVQASSVTGAQLVGISCGAVGSCVATGSNAARTSATLIETLQSNTWTHRTVPTPTGATTPVLGGVSCLTANACALVGSYQSSSGQQGFIDPGVNGGGSGSDTTPSNGVAVGMAASADGDGYWIATSTGFVEAFGDATFYGDEAGVALKKPIVAVEATPDGKGYWLLGGDGGIFTFGDANFYGFTGALTLARPVVGMASTADGKGYWIVASDGGVFSYGDAAFQGSTGNIHLNKPVVGIATDLATGGYWLVASDGGVFSFNAHFYGSTGDLTLNKPIVGIEAAPDGSGYRFVASDGGIFSFNLPFEGSNGNSHLPAPVVGLTASGSAGYWMIDQLGDIYSFGGTGYYGGGV
jgi:hypothetical protein